MISVAKAFALIEGSVPVLKPEYLPLAACRGLILVEDIYAPMDVPPFDNAAMDGYAIIYDDIHANKDIIIKEKIQAGAIADHPLQAGEAYRIFTGAPIPDGADTVVAQECCTVIDNKLIIDSTSITQGMHIRKKATQTAAGTIIATKGTRLTTGLLSYIATMGIDKCCVIPSPRVGIIITGDEVVPIGTPLSGAGIYESNSTTITLLLAEIGIVPRFIHTCIDDYKLLRDMIGKVLPTVDLLLTTGGISVGDYDFIKPAMDDLGVDTVFYKVKQKPGKPLYLGKKENTIILSMPGNPAAVFTSFVIYARKIIALMEGKRDINPIVKGVLNHYWETKSGLTHFLKASVHDGVVTILDGQLSYQMHSFAHADALAIIPEDRTQVSKGDTIEYIVI